MSRAKKIGCLIPAILIMVIVVGVAVAVAVVLNSTPNELGFGKEEIAEGFSFDSLGFGDVKIKDMLSYIEDLFDEPKKRDMITNPITEADASEVLANVQAADNLPTYSYGSPNYAKIISGSTPLYYGNNYLMEYSDTNIAYILNQAVEQSADEVKKDVSIKALRKLEANVVEVDIKETANGKHTIKTICVIDLDEVRDELEKELKRDLGSIGKKLVKELPSKVYVVVTNEIYANASGELVSSPKSVQINNVKNDKLNEIILNVVGNYISTEEYDADALNIIVGDLYNTLFAQLGKIGYKNGTTITYGPVGIKDGKIFLITNK